MLLESFVVHGSNKENITTSDQFRELNRVATGISIRLRINTIDGKVTPGIEDIAEASAKRDRAHIVPAGSYGMCKLGLPTQVPLSIVYYADTSARKAKSANKLLRLKKRAQKIFLLLTKSASWSFRLCVQLEKIMQRTKKCN